GASRPSSVRLSRKFATSAEPRSRLRRNEKRSGTNLRAAASAPLSQLSSAIFWESMTSPIGSSATGPETQSELRAALFVDFADVRRGPRVDAVLPAGLAADDLEIALIRELRPL